MGYFLDEKGNKKSNKTQAEIEFLDAFKEARAFERGEINLPTLDEVLVELKAKVKV